MGSLQREINTKRPGLFVIGSGLVTSVISLFLVFLLGAAPIAFREWAGR